MVGFTQKLNIGGALRVFSLCVYKTVRKDFSDVWDVFWVVEGWSGSVQTNVHALVFYAKRGMTVCVACRRRRKGRLLLGSWI